MKRFSWVLWCILAGMSYGCNNDVAIDPEVAKCIKVGGMIENGKCKCGELINLGCKDDFQYQCKYGLLEIMECLYSTCDEHNKYCEKKCFIGATKCENGTKYECIDGAWGNSYVCENGCNENNLTCKTECEEDTTKCELSDNRSIYYECIHGVWEKQGECGDKCADGKACTSCENPNHYICNNNELFKCDKKKGNNRIYSM